SVRIHSPQEIRGGRCPALRARAVRQRLPLYCSVLRQAEDVERATRTTVAASIVSGGVLPDLRVARGTRGDDRDVLLAVRAREADRRAAEVAAGAERPDDLAVASIHGAEEARVRAAEDEVASRDHDRLVVATDGGLQ